MQNSIYLFRKYAFCENLVQKIKNICSSWNLVLEVIETWRIQWWYLIFRFLTRNTLFWQIWFQKTVCLSWYLVPKLIGICRIDGDVHFISFRLKITFLGKSVPKNRSCPCKLKFCTKPNSNIQNSMMIYFFVCLRPILGKFGPQFFTKANTIMQNSKVLFTFSIFEPK